MKKEHSGLSSKSLLAALLIGLVLLLDAMAAAPALHELIHKDAESASHSCAVTLFAHGKVDSAATVVPIVVLAVAVEATQHQSLSVFSTAIENLPLGRAPPSFCTAS